MKKEKKNFFANLNEKDIIDNRKFWHTVKPFLLDKIKSTENTIFVNYEKIKSDEKEVANILNNLFSNNIKSLKISEYYDEDKLPHSPSRHPNLKTIIKY